MVKRGKTPRIVCFRNMWTQSWGLMFRKPRRGTAYVFLFRRPMRGPFHMLFCFWPIDLYLLDEDRRVVDMKLGFAPFSVYSPRKPFLYAIEVPEGDVALKMGERAGWLLRNL